jgi:hypothetical protein
MPGLNVYDQTVASFASLTGIETLTNKTINATNNTVTNVSNLSVKQQNDTTNTTVNGARIESGWGVIVIGAASNASEAVAFQTAFGSAPIVTVTYAGDHASATTRGSGGNTVKGPVSIKAYGESTSGFTVHIHSSDGTIWAAGNTVFYNWTATGA